MGKEARENLNEKRLNWSIDYHFLVLTKSLAKSNFREEGFILSYSLRMAAGLREVGHMVSVRKQWKQMLC